MDILYVSVCTNDMFLWKILENTKIKLPLMHLNSITWNVGYILFGIIFSLSI